MKKPNKLNGTPLEDWFEDFIKNKLKLSKYFRSPGQMQLNNFDTEASPDQNLEVDGILISGKSMIIFEFKNDNKYLKEKIKKFLRNADVIRNATSKQLIANYKIPKRFENDLDNIDRYRFVYLNLSEAFNKEKFNRSDFRPVFNYYQNLYFLNFNDTNYLQYLNSVIGEQAKFEFYSQINISLADIASSSQKEIIPDETFLVKNKIITTKRDKADLYLFSIKVEDLLSIASVSRYNGLPLLFDNEVQGYQRIINPKKVEDIAKKFIGKSSYTIFPNSIIAILPKDAKFQAKKSNLKIPNKFCSLEIIDGQHRLFAYSHKSISAKIRKNSELIVAGLKLNNYDKKDEIAARIFCEINSTQSKVSKNLLYQLKYDVIGEKSLEALASKSLLLCNDKKGKALSNIFLTNVLVKKNSIGLSPIPLTTIVDTELIYFVRGEKVGGGEISDTLYETIFDIKKKKYTNSSLKFCKNLSNILTQYFNNVKAVYPKDFHLKSNSYLQSSKYYSVFIRILRKHLFNDKKKVSTIKNVLKIQKKKLSTSSKASDSCFFCKSNNNFPKLKLGVESIYNEIKP